MFQLGLERCPRCGDELKIIAAILGAQVIDNNLTHLGLRAQVTPRSPVWRQALQAA